MSTISSKTVITPDSNIGALLKECPQLEDVLLEMSPAFAHLRNPVLRKTVAKVASLRQVAKIGNVDLAEMVNKLRQAAGIDETWSQQDDAGISSDAPAWMTNATVARSLDARPVIAGGGHPLEQVMSELKLLKPGEIFELITPFLPAPLLDVVRKKGFEIWTNSSEGVFHNFISRQL